MAPLESDEEEVKKGTEVKILNPSKLWLKLPILLASIKTGNNSYKIRIEVRKIKFLLHQHNKIINTIYNDLIKSLW